MLDENVRKGREAAAKYRELNKNTVEKLESHDPKAKIWYFKKTNIDENASKFHEKPKPIPKPVKKKKAKKKIIRNLSGFETMREQRTKIADERARHAISLFEQNFTRKEICAKLNIARGTLTKYFNRFKK